MKDRSSRPCNHSRWFSLAVFVPALGTLVGTETVQAQPIIATPDGTGTVVTQQGDNTTITAGTHSPDGTNLFHSFETFSLEAGHSANFVADPSVQNVLSRVSGGDPSVINGQLSVEGAGQPNLYFMNPAGVLIGPEANVNLPGSLNVTTADAIGFDQAVFSATEENNYAALNAAPTGELVFSSPQPGSIVNQGELSVTSDSSIALVGGSVASTGDLSAPGGLVSIIAAPGESTVHLRQPDSLLSLEVAVTTNEYEQPITSSITPLALPELLTHSAQSHANTLSVNADGTVRLETTTSSTPVELGNIEPGSTVVAGNISVAADSEQSREMSGEMGGYIALLGEHVSVVEGTLTASGIDGGGTIHIGGDFRGAATLPTAGETWVGEKVQISADALQTGEGGRVSVWADDTTQYLGEISATGGQMEGNGGQVEVSGRESLVFAGGVDTRAENGLAGSLLLDPENILITNAQPGADDAALNDYEVRSSDGFEQMTISAAVLESLAENSSITLEATNNIVVENLDDDALTFSSAVGEITLTADSDRNRNGSVIFRDRNDTLTAPGRSLNLSGKFLFLGNLNTSSPTGGGAINLQASGSIFTGDINTSSTLGPGGAIDLLAGSAITTGTINTEGAVDAGPVDANSLTSGISTGELVAGDNNVILTAPGEVLVNGIPFPEELEEPPEPPTPSLPEETFPGTSAFFTSLSTLSSQALSSQASAPSSFGGSFLLADASDIEADSSRYGAGRTVLSAEEADAAIAATEERSTQLFSNYFGRELAAEELSFPDVQQVLANAERDTGSRTAVIYARAPQSPSETGSVKRSADEMNNASASPLELLLFTATGEPIKITMPDVAPETLASTVEDFRADLATSARRGGDYYLQPAQQLYEWLVEPLENDLATVGVETLVFAMDEGLRTIPLGALHDGTSFLVEKFSLGTVPSLGMIDTQYASLDSSQVLAMGISDFGQFDRFNDLPGVPDEVKAIAEDWPGSSFLNEEFTEQALIEQRWHGLSPGESQTPYQIIHLATHAKMNAGSIDNSYIQLWDEQLALNELGQLGWDSPAVQLLVLSACNTALDSPEAEMGFAGLAIASGVSSAMASLWSVSDLGTQALMDEFYTQLRAVPTKAEALQQAQLSLLHSDNEFSHPYYWSGFTMVGSPW
ncbi:MAG: CHAT domain-containing protein [Cyanobacteria bacterium J06560_6]